MRVEITGQLWLEPFNRDHQEALVRHLNDYSIHLNTLFIPYPYTDKDARNWIEYSLAHQARTTAIEHFGIVHEARGLIGGIGLIRNDIPPYSHWAEIGYWVGKDHRGGGVASAAVGAFIQYIWAHFTFQKLVAYTRADNFVSQAVLRRNGFRQEGVFEKHMHKEGQYFDCIAFGLLK